MSDILMHYASKYYDPVKAHEYYMEHRKLVGRRKTSDLTEEGQKAASYVKKQIDTERDAEIQTVKTELETNISDIKTKIEELKTLSEEEREQQKAAINAQIEEAKKVAADRKAELMEQLGIRVANRNQETKEKIAQDTAVDQRRMDTLRAQIKSTRKGDYARKEALQEQINSINSDRAEKNAETKAELASANQQDRSSTSKEKQGVSDELRSETNTIRKSYQDFVKENRKALSTNVSDLRGNITKLRSETKEKISEITQKYDEVYLDELDKLHAEYTKPETSGKSSKKSKGSSTSYSSNRNKNRTPRQENTKPLTEADKVRSKFKSLREKR